MPTELDLFEQSEPSPEERVLSISELTGLVREAIEGHVGRVVVLGEVSNFRRQTSGHCYFSLKDEGAVIAAVMFRGAALGAMRHLRDGALILAEGEVTVYEARGQYQIVVRKVRPWGEGDLRTRFEALKTKLAAEGLFDVAKKRPLPKHAQRVIVLTSRAGAALRDFCNVMARRSPRTEILLVDVPVQGDGAAAVMAASLQRVNRWLKESKVRADALALIRGGGSVEDLWAFNDEALARALAACPIPTVSGVGHETDVSIADFVADVRAPTPSAAAEILSGDDAISLQKIMELPQRLRNITNLRLSQKAQLLRLAASSPALLRPSRVVEMLCQKLDDAHQALSQARDSMILDKSQKLRDVSHAMILHRPSLIIKSHKQRLETYQAKLTLLDPRNVLKLGYAWVKNERGMIVRGKVEVAPGERIQITLRDGRIPAVVTEEQSSMPARRFTSCRHRM